MPFSMGSNRSATDVSSAGSQLAACHSSAISSGGCQRTTRPTSNRTFRHLPVGPALELQPEPQERGRQFLNHCVECGGPIQLKSMLVRMSMLPSFTDKIQFAPQADSDVIICRPDGKAQSAEDFGSRFGIWA